MKRAIWIIIAIIILVGAAITWRAFTISVPHRPDVPATAAMVQRGEYLVTAGDCISCHTVAGGQPFAGGREFDLGNMGKLYSPNITPDADTGIGTWSDDDFRNAVQLGVAKGGVHLYPAFPYASFTILSDEDVLAIKAYLFSLKPVHANVPQDAMNFPYNQRWLMAYWSWLFDSNERFKPDSNMSADWNRGRYLVEGLGHCGECHTPRNILQARKSSEAYSGALTQGWKAYNISSDQQSGVGGWTDDALASYLSTGFAQGHGPATGPMGEAVGNSLRHLTAPDIHAMVTYIRTLKGIHTDEVAAVISPAAGQSPSQLHGRDVFAATCANCHRPDGTGVESTYAALAGSRTVADPQAINLTQVILHGASMETQYGNVSMPAFGMGHDNADLAAVINYVTTELGGHDAQLTAANVAARR